MPQTQNPAPKNPAVKISVDELLEKMSKLEGELQNTKAELKAANKERDEANALINAQTRASLMSKARGLTNIPDAKLNVMSVDELETVVNLAGQLKRPVAKSIRFSTDAIENAGIIDLYHERLNRSR